jgi:hypothetical protein
MCTSLTLEIFFYLFLRCVFLWIRLNEVYFRAMDVVLPQFPQQIGTGVCYCKD